MLLKAVLRLCVMEDLLEGRIFQGGAVDVSGDPAERDDRKLLRINGY